MIDILHRRPLFAAIVGFVALFVVLSSFPIVPETEQAVVVRFGKPVRILNRFQENHPIGARGAGISWRIPFAEQVVWIDKRVLDVDMAPQQVLSTDQRRLQVDAFARYRIVDPLLMYIRATTVDNLQGQLRTILGSEVRNELAKQPFSALLSPERQGVMNDVRQALNAKSAEYGVQILDVRIKKTDLPDGAPLDSAFDRMRTARQQEARSDADAEAARTYAASFGKDPQFYDFYRAMQSYRATFIGEPGKPNSSPTTVILSPQDDYLKEFSGRAR